MMQHAKRVVGGAVLAFLVGVAPPALASQATDRTSVEQVKKDVGQAIESIKAYSADRREEAAARARAAIERLDGHIARLEDRVNTEWDRMDRAARERLRPTLQALRRQRNDLAEWSGRMRESSAGAWDHIKQGFLESYRALADAFAKAENEFNK